MWGQKVPREECLGDFSRPVGADVGNKKSRTVTRADLLEGCAAHGRERREHKMLKNWVEAILLNQAM